MADKQKIAALLNAIKENDDAEVNKIVAEAAKDFSQISIEERYDILLAVHIKLFGGEKEKIDRDVGILAKSTDLEVKYSFLATTLYEQLNIPPDESDIAAGLVSEAFNYIGKSLEDINKGIEQFLKTQQKKEEAFKNSVLFDGPKKIQ